MNNVNISGNPVIAPYVMPSTIDKLYPSTKLLCLVLGRAPAYVVVFAFEANCGMILRRLINENHYLANGEKLVVSPHFGKQPNSTKFVCRKGREFFPCGGIEVEIDTFSEDDWLTLSIPKGSYISSEYGFNFSEAFASDLRNSISTISPNYFPLINAGLRAMSYEVTPCYYSVKRDREKGTLSLRLK